MGHPARSTSSPSSRAETREDNDECGGSPLVSHPDGQYDHDHDGETYVVIK